MQLPLLSPILEDMNKKLLVSLGVVGILIVLGLTVSFITKDKLRPELTATLETNTTLVEIGNLGVQRATRSETQQIATNIAIVTLSDNRTLTEYWRKRHGKKLPQNQKVFKGELAKIISELEDISHGPTFDSHYLELITQQLRTNTDRLKSIYQQTDQVELRTIVEATHNHQIQLLEQLESPGRAQ